MVDHLEMRRALNRAEQALTAPDSGGWSKVNEVWTETTDDLYLDEIDFQVKKQGSFRITVDGFPRQGNRYLRRKILLAFPDAAIPFPLCHKEVAFKEAIADKDFVFSDDHFVFSTFRDPLKSVSSYISHFIEQNNVNGILNPLKDYIYTEDDYFYINHRKETRGIGGIFFDRLNIESDMSFEKNFAFWQDVGKTFAPTYVELINRNKNKTFTEKNKQWQLLRRGRYVEFNLVYDKGTKFGLETNGRVESILMSLPKIAGWEYDFKTEKNSEEEKTLSLLKKGIDWV